MKNYEVEFTILNSKSYDLTGFVQTHTQDYFEPGWGINLLFHDTFEHFFENSRYFSTKELSQAGECVAMGIRQFFYEKSGLIQKYAGYNKYNGIEWNSWTTCLVQVSESNRGYEYKYPNDFNFKHLSAWNGKNEFGGMAEAYNEYKGMKPFYHDIERAYSYGYWLGKHLFHDRIDIIDSFCENLSFFLTHTDMENVDPYGICDSISDRETFTVKVSGKSIIGKFSNGVTISDSKNWGKSVDQWEKLLFAEY